MFQDIYELRHHEGSCIAKKVNHYNTGGDAVMNCSIVADDSRSYTLAAGQEGYCQIYNLRYKLVAHKDGQEESKFL